MKKIGKNIYSVLRWSERYTKTDMLYLMKNGFWVTFGQSVNSILSLVLIIAFANLLPKETYGTYRYILSLAGVLNIFTLTGMNSAVARAVASGDENALKVSVKYQLKWNALMLVALWSISGYYLINGDNIFAISFFILGVFVPPTLALNTYGAYLEGKKEFKFANILNILSSIVYVSGALAAAFWGKEVVWLVTAYALATFMSTLTFYVLTLRKFKPSGATKDDSTLKYGKELTIIGFIGPITSQIDKIILAHFWGPAQLATYSLAMAVPARAISFIKNWVGIGFPKFSAKTPQELNIVFYRRILQGVSVGIIMTLIYEVISPYLFKYLLPQYMDGLLYSQILALGFIFAMPNRYISLLFQSQKLSKTIFINSIINSIIAILLYVVLGIWGGIIGLVTAFVAISFSSMCINIAMWKIETKP